MITKQEAVNRVYQHFIVENQPYSLDKVEDRGYYSCRYRSASGAKCAIGIMIPDELYEECFEGFNTVNLFNKSPELKAMFEEGDGFWIALQRCHDNTYRSYRD